MADRPSFGKIDPRVSRSIWECHQGGQTEAEAVARCHSLGFRAVTTEFVRFAFAGFDRAVPRSKPPANGDEPGGRPAG